MYDRIVSERDPVLREKAKPVAQKDIGSPKLNRLIKKMQALLAKEEYGVGLAAPQVGVSARLFIVSGRALAWDERAASKRAAGAPESTDSAPTPKDMTLINPEIIRSSRAKKEMDEGCLSVPGRYGNVIRHEKVSIRAQNEAGARTTRHATGLLAHIFQHEVDHLNGILYTDKALSVKPWDENKKRRTKTVARPT